MKKFLLPVIILLLVISCGKKKQVIASGTIEENGYVYQTWEEVIAADDSAFVIYKDGPTGKIRSIKKAKNDSELRDSTYTHEFSFVPSGKRMMIQKYIRKKRDGKWIQYYEDGKLAGETIFENGLMQGYTVWFENGKVLTTGGLLADSTFRHREYFSNNILSKEMFTDKNGNGHCTYWHPNGQVKSSGPITGFERSGIWKSRDTAGTEVENELLGIPRK
ncbi:MAG: hypothetical protein M3R17_20885 [Bacteroidota bacterium]|nr:hypothetical protein [Bacteroidota bacterium]